MSYSARTTYGRHPSPSFSEPIVSLIETMRGFEEHLFLLEARLQVVLHLTGYSFTTTPENAPKTLN
jgi:hypothetical protein